MLQKSHSLNQNITLPFELRTTFSHHSSLFPLYLPTKWLNQNLMWKKSDLVGGNWVLVGGGEFKNFWLIGGESPHPPTRENPAIHSAMIVRSPSKIFWNISSGCSIWWTFYNANFLLFSIKVRIIEPLLQTTFGIFKKSFSEHFS